VANIVNLTLQAGAYVRQPSLAIVLVLGGEAPPPEPGLPPFGGLPVRAPWGRIARTAAGGPALGWGRVDGTAGNGPRLRWGQVASTAAAGPRLPWDGAGGGPAHTLRAPWRRAGLGGHAPIALPWQAGRPVRAAAALPWQAAQPLHRGLRAPWGAAQPAHRGSRWPWGPAQPKGIARALPWGLARFIIGPGQQPVQLPVVPSPVLGWLPLRLCRPLAPDRLHLVLGLNPCTGWAGPGGQRVIEPRSAYVQQHTLSIVRLPDLTPLPAFTASWAAERSDFAWSLSFTGPPALLELLAPVAGLPRLLRLELDGMQWEFAVDRLRRNRAFGERSVTVTARSVSMLLAEPYRTPQAYLNSVPMTAQQVLEDVLQFTGVGLDWRATDWLLPAGVWSGTGTPLAAVRRVADTIRGVVASPRTGSVVAVAPRYQVPPWEWATLTPDVVIALDAVVTEGYERQDRAVAEGIYVSGQQQGVLALVRRLGTGPAADKLLPLETDALITELDAARQRGIARLGEAGPQVLMTLQVPVLTGAGEPGVVDVGEIVEVPDPEGTWRGQVTGVQVSAQVDESGVLVDQVLTVERHL
jgi:hypothetical protein